MKTFERVLAMFDQEPFYLPRLPIFHFDIIQTLKSNDKVVMIQHQKPKLINLILIELSCVERILLIKNKIAKIASNLNIQSQERTNILLEKDKNDHFLNNEDRVRLWKRIGATTVYFVSRKRQNKNKKKGNKKFQKMLIF
ncbi:hypothetical protein BpHYR1_052206 [Brachionus plicatilis]|uniref:Uncharacterized protein n=1 Tax=Brachionus plicatilis TaxID=10195 RepID=A0A3M7S416_BRAPC|nr:hypothetical protein BpHYR1_052206 [Brachionus plicatilis]